MPRNFRDYALIVATLAALGFLLFAIAGCGTESRQSAQSVAVTPAPLSTPTALTDCNPPITPAAGHVVRGYSYRVWSADCQQVQQVTTWVDTARPGPEWAEAETPCVESAPDQKVCR